MASQGYNESTRAQCISPVANTDDIMLLLQGCRVILILMEETPSRARDKDNAQTGP